MGLKIMTLNVSVNKIEEIPEQLGELILLKELNLSFNKLEVFVVPTNNTHECLTRLCASSSVFLYDLGTYDAYDAFNASIT
jgi:Leucine-rich repeat (LRR) protein